MALRIDAPAKVNLGLEVLGRRPDGYHELVSVVQCIDLCDTLAADESGEVTLDVVPGLGPVESNLVYRAALRLRERSSPGQGARLVLEKHIPVAAGLGGGSSDAAAALRLLRQLWRISIPPAELQRIGAELGSDVPLFLKGAASLIQGRGDRVRRLRPLKTGWFVIAVPSWAVLDKTARVYRALEPGDFSSGRQARTLADALQEGRPIDQDLFVNGLEPAARRVFPELANLQEELRRATGGAFLVSGAGPALFRLEASRSAAEWYAERAMLLGLDAHLARPVARLPGVQGSRGA